jgi:hypothetical protein
MQTTRYFEEQVLRKRPDIRRDWCERAIRTPEYRTVQADGRLRFWVFVAELGKYLRVVTLEDGETVHNAFPDRGFRADQHEEHKV